MDHFSLGSPHEQASAGSEGGILVHEIEEEDLFEGQLAQRGHCIDFLHEILMDKLVLGVPLHPVVEALRDGKQLHEFEEAVESVVEGTDDGLPTSEGSVIDLHLESEGDVGFDGPNVGHHCGLHYCKQDQRGQQALHRINHQTSYYNLPTITSK